MIDYGQMCTKAGREADKIIFNEWEEGRINTRQCLTMFMGHNRFYADITIFDLQDFALWLRSLGYIRRTRYEQQKY